MNIFILTIGTRGDVQPFIALALELKSAGHHPTICTCESFRSMIEMHGIAYGFINDDFMQLINSEAGREVMEDATNLYQMFKVFRKMGKIAKPLQKAAIADSWRSMQEAKPDLVVAHPKAFYASHFAEKLMVPVVMAMLQPMYVPTKDFPMILFPESQWLRPFNRLTHKIVTTVTSLATAKYVNTWRVKNQMPPISRRADLLHTTSGRPIPVLHAFSKHLVPKPADWPRHAHVIGFWFLDQATSFQPSEELAQFLESGPPPVYIGFGSMSGRNPKRLTQIAVDAVLQTHQRGIIATGWGGLDPKELPRSMMKIDHAPHDWLFQRVAAVVHHGGAGSTAAGLRAGKPTVICPFFADQPFWGRRVSDYGAGPQPIPQKKLTSNNLAAAIHQAVTDPKIREAAELIGQKIQVEDGLSNAARLIEKYAQQFVSVGK
ncbi:glycosyltransferase [Poriferisphaera sp. WC338]|uniref:glycosyltransferase n=1 Tax=Poriferisphaera sp. WC338 TaxID=3425129 RepID=UPI003D815923